MSASNWTICPNCVKRSKDFKKAFADKYYGKLDSFLYGKILKEIDRAIEHVESYDSDEFEPDKDILEEMEKKEISIDCYNNNYDPDEILFNGQISSCLREDYEQGVNSDSTVYFYYSCSCDCGFDKTVKYEESKNKIIER